MIRVTGTVLRGGYSWANPGLILSSGRARGTVAQAHLVFPVMADIAWALEVSRDGERWHFFGKAWTHAGEPLLVHGLPRFVRYRRLDPDGPWSPPLERSGDEPIALINLDSATRTEIWPGQAQGGLPVLLPPGEEGRLLRFQRSADCESWTWALEFRGNRRRKP